MPRALDAAVAGQPFLLLFLGVMIPMILYTLWGVIDILTVPIARRRRATRRPQPARGPQLLGAILPPTRTTVVKHPLDRVEGTWVAILRLVHGDVLHDGRLAHLRQPEPLDRDHRTTQEKYSAKAQAVVDNYTVRTETDDKIPVVHPPGAATCT